MELWLARDKDGSLRLFYDAKPEKATDYWDNWTDTWFTIDNNLFPEVQWSDAEPTKVKLEIIK